MAHFLPEPTDGGSDDSDESATGRKKRGDSLPREVWILSGMTFLTTVGFGLIGPALPALASLFGISTALASIAISGFAAFRLAANLGFSGLLKKFRLRSVLFLGLAVQAVCSLLAGLAPDGFTFLLFRSVSGLGSAALTVSATALLLALVSDRQRGKAMSTYFGANALGAITGPAIGGLLAVGNPRLPLILYGLCLGIAALIALLALRAVREVRTLDSAPAADGSAPPSTFLVAKTLLLNPMFQLALWCHIAVGWVLYGVRTTTIPLYLGLVGISTAVIGVLMTIGAVSQVFGSAASGTASDRIGRMTPLMVGIVLGMAGVAVLTLSDDLWWLGVSFFLMGIAGGALAAVPAAIIGDVPLGNSGVGVALYWIVFDIAAIVGPMVSGLLADSAGFTPAFLLAQAPFIVTIGIGVVAAVWQRRQRLAP